MWWPHTDREKLHVALSLFAGVAALLCVALWRPLLGGEHELYTKLPLAYKLTQKRAINLTPLQMNGSEPLMLSDADGGDGGAVRYVPPRLVDIVNSMKHDAHTEGLSGVCAMNYNLPVSACFMPWYGRERDVVMFNLKMIGFSSENYMGDEWSLLCDRGNTAYGAERFKWVWIEFWDMSAERNILKVDGNLGRVIQQMAWLNQGVTVCDNWSLQRQADVLFDVSRFQRVDP